MSKGLYKKTEVVSGKSEVRGPSVVSFYSLLTTYAFRLTFLSLLTTYAFRLPTWGDFEYLGQGARPTGMGNSYTAISDDTYGIYYNPGAISFNRFPSVSAEYSRLWLGLSDGSNISNGSFGYVQPLKNSVMTLGLSLHSFSLAGYYSENIVTFAWSKKMSPVLGLGFGLKYLSQGYTMDEYTLGSYTGLRPDPVFDAGKRTSKTAFALDPGILWNFYPDYFAGVLIQNINQPDIGLAEKELLPMVLNFALAYRYDYARMNKFNFGIGATYSEGDLKINTGIEKWFGKRVWALRAGTGFGARQYFNLTFGMTVAFKSARIDYSASLPFGSIINVQGTHRISLVYSFIPLDEKITNEYEQLKAAKQESAASQQEIKTLKNKILELEVKLEEAKRTQPANISYLQEKISYLEKKLMEAQKKSVETPKPQALPGIVTPQEQPAAPVYTLPPVGEYTTPTAVEPAEPVAPVTPKIQKPVSKPKPTVTTHTVKEGDSLPSIAEKYYGDSSQWKKIYEANKSKIKRGQVEPGEVLVIP